MYGTLTASKLFYEDLTAFLISLGFQLNPFDHCVANKLVNGKQLTVTWHVDDLKISHVDPTVVGTLIDQLNLQYGKVKPLSESLNYII